MMDGAAQQPQQQQQDDAAAATACPESPERALWRRARHIIAEAETALHERLLDVKAARGRFTAASARLAQAKGEAERNKAALKRGSHVLAQTRAQVPSLTGELRVAETRASQAAGQAPILRVQAAGAELELATARGELRREEAAMEAYVAALRRGAGECAAAAEAEEAAAAAEAEMVEAGDKAADKAAGATAEAATTAAPAAVATAAAAP